MPVVKCVRECFDSALGRHYFPGDTDDLNPMSPVASHFEGWQPGTEIYCKIRGTKESPARNGTRVIPGVRPLDPAPQAPQAPQAPLDLLCPWCKEFEGKNEASLRTHQRSCKAKPVEE